MGFLSRLFGGSAAPAPPPNSVVIAPDLAEALAIPGTTLEATVDSALRRHLDAERRAAEAERRGEKIPFWLRREEGGSAEIEDLLRDRIAQRRTAEDSAPSQQA
jgi:hypothetical protein